jgi:ketosteroid isomerase-like protein
MNTTRILAACTVAASAALAACSGGSTPRHDRAADEAEIHKLIDSIAGSFKTGDMEKVLAIYADDVLVLGIDQPDVAGKDAWRKILADQPKDVTIEVRMDTKELEIAGDLAYERGTYTAEISSKATGALVQTVTNRHIHIFKRQPDGHWKAWRLMENSTSPARPSSPQPAQTEPPAR